MPRRAHGTAIRNGTHELAGSRSGALAARRVLERARPRYDISRGIPYGMIVPKEGVIANICR